ncbi:MAG: hypothetical protein DWH91_09200 [Planctomycetota bacterium]|nr:MAG: hypothetical protein DWH91_09200 [Planctomycetota bacterium]
MQQSRSTRKRTWVSLVAFAIIGLTAGLYTSFARSLPAPPVFPSDQAVVLQIVTAPTKSIIGGEQYDESQVTVLTSHRVNVLASGEGQTISSVVDGIPVNVAYAKSEAGPGKHSVLLHGINIGLPLRVRTSATSSLLSQVFCPARVAINADFHSSQNIMIHYNGEGRPNTFIRLRVDPEPDELPVIDISSFGSSGQQNGAPELCITPNLQM